MTLTPMKKANLLLLLVVFVWGLSYLFTKSGLQTLPPFTFLALRFGLGFIVAALVFIKHFSKINKKTLIGGSILGLFLFLTLACVYFGLQYTTISNAGFLGSLTVIFVPILSSIVYRKLPEKKIIIGSITATVGIALLTLESRTGFGIGDFICILAAVAYASHILIAKRLTNNKEIDALNLGIVQLGFTALYGTICAFLLETPHLPATESAWTAVLFLALFCTAFGFVGQVVAQKYTTPAHVGLIFALEPVFASAFAYLFASEELLPIQIVGAAIVFISVLYVETDIKELRGKSKSEAE
ncbi:DMT family transporter [Methanimicrococcus blatticola]|uniref:Drug/metabolite transporter (DMT)-like permease n=1 Tax=Methanimicrococcus blatticola TaxID=91560 RepID=A0A484F5K7_9EURY|nr:DMT family transporter [Methanimicrococcus blatticola]MBZ3935458.1 EamA family transporter [Methanimicrococcus blatticola]MCC2509102.1 DMT family transporter [Methanimicrococcus blatticola]TDQ69529.1 drug/metabolite transporter (DMT)-like permease [Methanimicrococcus blatticola]